MLIRCFQFGKGERGLFIRRTYKELEEVLLRCQELFPPHGAKWREKSMRWTFPNGAWIQFAYLDRDSDASHYQGKSFTCICIEEAGTFPSWAPIAKLKGTLRSAKGVPTQLLLTGNPGGPGANWVRSRYIDPAPQGWEPIREVNTRVLPNGERKTYQSERIYIPSRVTDNQILMQNDPEYIARLMETGSEQLVKAWLEGDFWAVDGAFFDNFDTQKHVMPPAMLPDWWTRYRACDWGSARPFCVLWFAVASEDWRHPETGHWVPKDALVVYREWYGVRYKPSGEVDANKGLRLYAEEVARGILEREAPGERIDFGVLDPSAFAQDGGPSIAERMFAATQGKVAFRRADNKRVSGLGAINGWDQLRARLGGEVIERHNREEQVPMIFFFNTCTHLLRTLPMMQHDENNPEDIDTSAEDHAVDCARYGVVARPYTRATPVDPKKGLTTIADVTLDQLWYDRSNSAGNNSITPRI